MLKFPFLRGAVRHCKLIGEDPEFKALRARNESRLAALKASNRRTEDKSESTAARHSAAQLSNADIQRLYNNLAAQQSSDPYGHGYAQQRSGIGPYGLIHIGGTDFWSGY